jgi:DNA-directed RNA polymerase subunit N (RpoN/RPB10)
MYTILACFTCGQPIGHLRQIYVDLVTEFAKNAKENDDKTPEYLALDVLAKKYNFDPTSYCCRRTIQCDYDLTNIIH